MDRNFDPNTVDVVACASTLGNLMRFARSAEATFRFDVELVGNTLFIIRNSKSDLIPNVYGYGHSFLDTFTKYASEVGESKSHQRIVSYQFGGLKCLVRFECDGFDVALDERHTSNPPLYGPAVSRPSSRDSASQSSAGKLVAQESLIEIKTRSQVRGPIDMAEHLPRLWVRQIPNVVLSYHNRGVFDEARETNVSDDILEWERDNQPQLKLFASALNQLIVEVRNAGRLRLEVYREGTGPLQLRKQCGLRQRSALPDKWRTRWTGEADLNSDQSSDEEASDSSDSLRYPTIHGPRVAVDPEDNDGGNNTKEAAVFDYEACGVYCGFCGHCT